MEADFQDLDFDRILN
eukprot:gene9395-10202_t